MALKLHSTHKLIINKPIVRPKDWPSVDLREELKFSLTQKALEKSGGGLPSMLDRDGVGVAVFHKESGSGHKGGYRGFPNAIHRQDGNYFHAMNAGTDPSTSVVEIEIGDHVRIVFTSENKHLQS